jgi:primosomal protein N' (replication factor Y) (superfamily II helicase)
MVAGGDDRYVARADDWMELGRVLGSGERPVGSRLRIAVDPPR